MFDGTSLIALANTIEQILWGLHWRLSNCSSLYRVCAIAHLEDSVMTSLMKAEKRQLYGKGEDPLYNGRHDHQLQGFKSWGESNKLICQVLD